MDSKEDHNQSPNDLKIQMLLSDEFNNEGNADACNNRKNSIGNCCSQTGKKTRPSALVQSSLNAQNTNGPEWNGYH